MTFSLFGRNVKKNLSSFVEDLNKYHPKIKFPHESNKELDNFLDPTVSFQENRLSPDLYIKLTEGSQYLHYSSSHPYPTKKSIAFDRTAPILKRVTLLNAREK